MDFTGSSTGLRSVRCQAWTNFQKTNDGGVNWSSYAELVVFETMDLLLVNDSVSYVSGNSFATNHAQLYKLTDTSAIQVFNADTLFFESDDNLEFPNSSTGYILMTDTNHISYLFKTTNHGNNWNLLLSDSINRLNSMSFPDSLNGYLCASNGATLKTTDGGSNWTELISPTTNSIRSVDFIDQNVGYLGCDVGEIYRTIDGGISWNIETSGTTSSLIKIQMMDSNTAYCIDQTGILFKNSNVLSTEILPDDAGFQSILSSNPSSESITVSLPNNSNVECVEIYDTCGKLVLTSIQSSVNVSALEAGVYVVRIKSDERQFTCRLLKK
ncbi:MAG: T9SS type A sorting domain-containing protein [Fluviicola sp.]